MADVRISGLQKFYGAVHALKGIDLSIGDGEFAVFVGPSGCGKSTLLRTIAGLEDMDDGQIAIGGRIVNDMRPRDRNIAMVFQNYALYPFLTVYDNVAFGLRARKVPEPEIKKRVDDAASMLSIGPLLLRYPRQLSGGQRQRVALARAMVRRPKVFLMDEPLSNLDAKLRGHMRAELKHMQHTLGITTIYVTHDQIEAMTLAHRVALLEGGKLQQLDTPANIYNDPANLFVAQFIGSPPMNVVQGGLEGSSFLTQGSKITVPVKGKVAKAVLGVRPEDCSVVAAGKGDIKGEIYATELIGDHTLVTVKTGQDMLTIKAAKDFSARLGEKAGVALARDRLFVFDAASGARVR